ncbi:MAG: hypothetical protein ABIJ92_00260 [Candidatus Aenigmatarchaeota archaeon]
MANIGVWESALRKTSNSIQASTYSTTDTYSRIKDMGLETVIWENFDLKDYPHRRDSIDFIKRFIKNNRPCLFIFDPKIPDVKKGFLFGVKKIGEVQEWIEKNKKDLRKYKYLITTQITNPGNGFVGSVFSDGDGKMLCETLHKPGVSNHRELSQPDQDISNHLDFFLADNFDLISTAKGLISSGIIKRIIEKFGHRKGYYEIVKGLQAGKNDIYTTGFDLRMDFPQTLYDAIYFDIRSRVKATTLKSMEM